MMSQFYKPLWKKCHGGPVTARPAPWDSLVASVMSVTDAEHGVRVKRSGDVKHLTKPDFGAQRLLSHERRAEEKAKKQHKTGLFGLLLREYFLCSTIKECYCT